MADPGSHRGRTIENVQKFNIPPPPTIIKTWMTPLPHNGNPVKRWETNSCSLNDLYRILTLIAVDKNTFQSVLSNFSARWILDWRIIFEELPTFITIPSNIFAQGGWRTGTNRNDLFGGEEGGSNFSNWKCKCFQLTKNEHFWNQQANNKKEKGNSTLGILPTTDRFSKERTWWLDPAEWQIFLKPASRKKKLTFLKCCLLTIDFKRFANSEMCLGRLTIPSPHRQFLEEEAIIILRLNSNYRFSRSLNRILKMNYESNPQKSHQRLWLNNGNYIKTVSNNRLPRSLNSILNAVCGSDPLMSHQRMFRLNYDQYWKIVFSS